MDSSYPVSGSKSGKPLSRPGHHHWRSRRHHTEKLLCQQGLRFRVPRPLGSLTLQAIPVVLYPSL